MSVRVLIAGLIAAFLGGMTAYIISVVHNAQPAPTEIALCSDEPGINDKINQVAFEALEAALRIHIQNLFLVWMKDPNLSAAHRGGQGVKNGAIAYLHARKGILDWNIPPCTKEPG